MWKAFASKLLRNRLVFLFLLLALTVVMGILGTGIHLSYEFVKVLPSNDSALIHYEQFKKTFGEDGSVMVFGFTDERLFEQERFNDFYRLGRSLRDIDGVKQVMSLGSVYNLRRNDSLMRFELMPLINGPLPDQATVDSIRTEISNLPFYREMLYNEDSHACLMAITFNDRELNSARRIEIVKEIQDRCGEFAGKYSLKMHYSGMPYIRTAVMKKVSSEMTLFMVLAIVVMAITLWAFFRSLNSVIMSLIVVAVGVVWSLGLIAIFDYRITLLSGLIPPLVMVIGVPNCVFLINKYHAEYARHRNKMKALSRMIQTIGITLFLANVTTAIGFGVLYFTHSSLLVEFGIVASIGVMVTYIITLILIPIILSFLPGPREKHTLHLEAKRVNALLKVIDHLVHQRRNAIYEDLKFFEKHFHGVLPFEILIDTREEKGVTADQGTVLYKINRMQKLFAEYPEFSRPISLVEAVKFTNQAYNDGDSRKYILPGAADLNRLSDYSGTVTGKKGMLSSFIDSSMRYTRVTVQMADVGSARMKQIITELRPRVDSIFDPGKYTVEFTGHSLMFTKSNDYLLYNLLESLLIEIVLITIVGFALFRSIRIILLSKLPVLIPLVITAGIMGFLEISFRPSTILIFSIAFGISSDGTIYFLTRYKQELRNAGTSVSEAISITIREIGLSMVYTTIILFFGFAIFAASGFGGTVALGILLSITLLMAMVTNLVLLPSILLTIDKRRSRKELLQPALIEIEEDEAED
jgi:predicted RND superfamily exporter protein